MIISHAHRFIFIKTKKTAGTSIEIALSQLCGPDDVITPITPEDEALRRSLGYRGPQHHAWEGRPVFYNHMSARLVRQAVGEGIWGSYFKFCFERNPWDKVISWYFWEYPTAPRPSLSEFIASGHAALVGGPGGYDLYTDGGQVIVDRVCRYEHMAQELLRIQQDLKLPPIPELPRAKGQFRTDRRPYRDWYSEADAEAVRQLFQREIDAFGFEF